MTIYSLDVLLFLFGTSLLFHVQFCCFLTCIQISQEADQVVWYSHLFQNFPQFLVIHTVKGFGIVKIITNYLFCIMLWEIILSQADDVISRTKNINTIFFSAKIPFFFHILIFSKLWCKFMSSLWEFYFVIYQSISWNITI